MQAWEAIQKTLDYMEEHYEEALTVEQLSTIAHLSRFYYQRLFYRLTGYTVIIGYPSGSCDQAGAAHAIYPGG